MQINAIVAMAENRVIGNQNQLPWHLPADLAFFKKTTMGKPIIMGRKTYLSIGRPLPNRQNIVISRDPAFKADGCDVFSSVDDALKAVNNCEEVFIIGGAQLFAACWDRIDRLYITLIHAEIVGDTFLPVINYTQWQEVSRELHAADIKNSYSYSFITLARKPI
jgi:dihydrofolate reductase